MRKESSEWDYQQKLKGEVEGVMGVLVEALKIREGVLKREVDGVRLRGSCVSARDGGEGWKMVGDWRDLQARIERFGGVVRRRERNESFEVISQENVDSGVVDRKEEMSGMDEDDDDEYDDDDNEGGGDDDDDKNGGFIFEYESEKDFNKNIYNNKYKSHLSIGEDNEQNNNETTNNKQTTINNNDKHQSQQNCESFKHGALENFISESFIFKLPPKIIETEEEVMVKDEEVPSFKFTFGGNDRSNDPSINTVSSENSDNGDDVSFTFNLQNGLPLKDSQETLQNALQNEESAFKSYNLQESDCTNKRNVKNRSLGLFEPFVFKVDGMMDGTDNSEKEEVERELEANWKANQSFCFRFLKDLKITEESREEEKNNGDSFKFHAIPSKHPKPSTYRPAKHHTNTTAQFVVCVNE